MGLPTFSIRRPVLVTMLWTSILILGMIALSQLHVELYQGQNRGIISILIRARGGLHPVEVEKQITQPVEEALATVSHLKNLFSTSRESESRIILEFEPGTNMNAAALEVRENFSAIEPRLPEEIERPVIANYDDSQAAILIFALTSQNLTPEELRELVETRLKPVLMRLDGVTSVEIYGGRERKVLIELDRNKMAAYQISVQDVLAILGQNNINLLAGSLKAGKLELGVRSLGLFEKIEEIGNLGLKVTRQGSIIPLKEVAVIKDSYLEPSDFARLNLEQNVTVEIKKASLARTIAIVKKIQPVLKNFEAEHKQDLDITLISNSAQIIKKAIQNVLMALFIGMLLAVIVIYLFLRQRILAWIVFLTIPTSVIATFVFMAMMDISLNIMTLSGLALAIGILVDSAIVIMENVFSKKEEIASHREAVEKGSEEVWLPLLASLVTTLVVFLPVVFVDKAVQLTYGGFAFTVCISLVASFLVAQMLVPMLITRWAKNSVCANSKHKTPSSLSKIAAGYQRIMQWNLSYRYPVVLVLLLVSLGAIFAISRRPIDWPKTFEENEFSVVVFPLAGARLETNDEVVQKIEGLLKQIPDVDLFSSMIRKDEIRIFVRLKPLHGRAYPKREILRLIAAEGNKMIQEIHPDYSLMVDEGAFSEGKQKLSLNVFGYENDVLDRLATEVILKIQSVPGLTNLVKTDLRKRPEFALVVEKDQASLYGLTTRAIADSVHAQARGMVPTRFHDLEKGEEIETIARLREKDRLKIEDFRHIRVANENGTQIPLGEIASIYPTEGPQAILRKDKHRYIFIQGDVSLPVESVAENVARHLKDLSFPDGYYWRFGKTYTGLLESKADLIMALILSLGLIYMVLACLFQSYLQPVLVMLSVPMASAGIWIGLTVSQTPLSQQVFIGMILLAGYVVNSAILLVDRNNHLRTSGISRDEALIQAGSDRLRPILMTTCSTGFGFLPLALSWAQSSQLWSPMAITVIAGLLSSTILTLFILPDFILIAEEAAERVRSKQKGHSTQ